MIDYRLLRCDNIMELNIVNRLDLESDNVKFSLLSTNPIVNSQFQSTNPRRYDDIILAID
jgi:hypothetical protein